MTVVTIPQWLGVLAESYLALCVLCFLYILFDQRKRPAPMMRVMLWVWPINALWSGPLGVWAYRCIGVAREAHMHMEMAQGAKHTSMSAMPAMAKMPNMPMDMPMNMPMDMPMPTAKTTRPSWTSVTAGTLHCGAGCTLADIAGPWLFRLAPFVVMGSTVYGEWAFDYVLALAIGVIFQYAGLASMSKEHGLKLVWRAFRVDVLSLTAWQVGMYGWMALVIFSLLGPLSPANPVFWLMMQVSMACGFITAYPMNYMLIRMGVKSAM